MLVSIYDARNGNIRFVNVAVISEMKKQTN